MLGLDVHDALDELVGLVVAVLGTEGQHGGLNVVVRTVADAGVDVDTNGQLVVLGLGDESVVHGDVVLIVPDAVGVAFVVNVEGEGSGLGDLDLQGVRVLLIQGVLIIGLDGGVGVLSGLGGPA